MYEACDCHASRTIRSSYVYDFKKRDGEGPRASHSLLPGPFSSRPAKLH